ncbi:conserved Plasmodium protein, unknown function [Plasmodium relictum]|uniref:Oocyst capsule protein n=1 Tax=Plasmodium relictum TaxID=85471 RepID=A0A1J1H0Y6_PLARL|nr:conserved Plasmodium protein, unknown function [Plasmodium relictum]CRG98577.1 conserved Plasmodium protein, unknown function [Plasmodium relictum]
MVIFLLVYFLVYFIGTGNEIISDKDVISFNNLNENRIMRYYSSFNSDSCYFWYYIKEDFFEIIYLKNDIKKKEQKSKKIEKNRGKWVTTTNICSNEILILLNKNKKICKSLLSFIIRVDKKNKQKKHIYVEYNVTDHIFMTNNYIVTYVNEKYKQIIYVISDNKKNICSKSNIFKVYFDEHYIKYAKVKYNKSRYELLIETKKKTGITKLFIVLRNKCKDIFFFVIIFIYEYLLLLPNKLEFPEESIIKLVLKKRDSIIDSNCLYAFHKDRYVLKRDVEIKKIEEQYLLKYNQKNIIKKNLEHIKLLKCFELNYITSFQNKYKIEPSKNYDIISNEVIRVKKNINEDNMHIIIKNIENKQKFTSLLYIYKVKETDVNCIYPIYHNKPNFLSSKKNKSNEKNLIQNEIYKLRNHFYYQNNYYFDNYYIKNYFINNKNGKQSLHFILGRRYLCTIQLYNENNRKLYNTNNNKNNKYKWILSLNKNNFNIYTLYKVDENLANYFLTVYNGINSFHIFYKSYNKIYKDIIISNPVICYIKDDFIMTILFIVPDEKFYYKCYGGFKNKYIVKVINKYNFLNVNISESSIEIKRKRMNINNNNNKKEYVYHKNKLNYIIILFCDEYDFNNCFISKIHIFEKISDYSIVVEKNFIEINEITNIYFFMNYSINNLDISDKLTFIKKKKKIYLNNVPTKEEEKLSRKMKYFYKSLFIFSSLLYNTSKKKRKLIKIEKGYLKKKKKNSNTKIKLNTCFHKINNDIIINYDKDSIEIKKNIYNFSKLPIKYKDACAFIQIKGKKKGNALIEMKYRKNKKLSKNVIIHTYKKVKILFCQDFVCSKFIKFNQVGNVIVYDGFNEIPFKVNIFPEMGMKELVIRENEFLNEKYKGNIALFKNLFISEKFSYIFQTFSQKVIFKNIFNNDVFFENKTHYPAKLYNRKLYEYEFIYDHSLLNEKHKEETKSKTNKTKKNNSNNYYNIYKNNMSSINYYDIYFLIKKYYIIYCNSSKSKYIKSNIVVEMINSNKTTIYTKNYFPVHFKYPSSMHITIFDKNVKNLYVLNDDNISLYKNNDYYFKAFLIDENENVILTNETFQYTLEPYLLDFQQKCFKNKSNYLEIEQKKRKHIINTNNKILLNYNNKNVNYFQYGNEYFNDLNDFKNFTNNLFLLSVKYNYKSDNRFDYFEKHLFLNFYDKIYTYYDNLTLFYSKHIYYKFFICNASIKSLDYSFKGNRQIEILNYIDEEKLYYNKKKVYSIVDLNNISYLKHCTPIYISSNYIVEGTLTIKNKLIYETEHLDVNIIFNKISKVKISILSKNVEINQLIPLRIEFFDEHNKKFQYIPKEFLKIKLLYDYSKIYIKYIDFRLKENHKILNEIKKKFEINDLLSDLFYYVHCSIPNKYYVQIEVTYKLYNKYISILSNIIELVIYSRGILYNERNMLLYPFNQTIELLFRFDHPLISKVVCISKNDYVIKVQKILRTDEVNKYICLIKTENIGISEIHIYPIFESYYDIFPRKNFIPLEKFDLDFYEIEKYYLNYYKYKKKNFNDIEEESIRNLYFFKIDITVDLLYTIELFHNDTFYLPLNKELSTFVKFNDKLKNIFTFIDFSILNNNNNNCNSYKLEYFVNNKNITINDKMENMEDTILKKSIHLKKKNRGNKKKTITKNLISSSDNFLSIKAYKEGSYLLYLNFMCDNNIISSEVYNIHVKNNFKNINLPYIYLSTNSLYEFHQNFHYFNIFNKHYPLSITKKIYTEEKENEHFIYFRDKQKKVEKKIKVYISDIIGAKVNNYYSKYIPLNVIQYFHIDLYNKNIESVMFPLNAKLFLNISHSSILSAKIINKNHIFVIPHKIGCSFINIHFKLYNIYKENGKYFFKIYKDIEIGRIHICIQSSIKQKYFYQKKKFFFVSRLYQLLHDYNKQFFFQPYVCLNSVIKNRNKDNKLSESEFYNYFKHYEKKKFIRNIEDLFLPHKKYFSIINHYCTHMKL